MTKSIAKSRYRLFQRGNGIYYSECAVTGKQRSLRTKNEGVAQGIVAEMNEAQASTQVQRVKAIATLSVCDPLMATRTWQDVERELCAKGKAQTQARKRREFKHQRYSRIRTKPLIETTVEDFRAVMKNGGPSTIDYLKRLHNLAIGLNWLVRPVIPPKHWKTVTPKPRRGITQEEQKLILKLEKNAERNLYYQILWETGAAQTDGAQLRAENIDWSEEVLTYARRKTGSVARLKIGTGLKKVLGQLPKAGLLFPHIATTTESARAAEFCRRIRVAGLSGISLHSYRYAWAERAANKGLTERQAQAALGQNSVAVHRHYAKGACPICPALD